MKAAHKVSQKWPPDKAPYIMLLLDLRYVPITGKNLSLFFFSMKLVTGLVCS